MTPEKISAAIKKPNSRPITTNGVTAHRGNSTKFPENTLPAFESALNLGVDWIELDIQQTRDGKLVSIHDKTTGRVGDFELEVAEVDYDELKKVDVAFQFRKKNKLTNGICPKGIVPLLSEIIHLVKIQEKTRISINPKASVVEEVYRTIKKLDAIEWVGFNGMELEHMIRVKSLNTSIPVFFDRFQSDIDEDILTAIKHGFESIILHYSQIIKSKIDSIHKAGLMAGCWNIDDQSLMSKFLKMGIDIIYTNDPAMLLKTKNA